MNVFQKISDHWLFIEDRFLPDELRGRDTLTTWRERALYLFCLSVIIFGFIALIPSVIMAYQRDLTGVMILDIVAYAMIFVLLVPTRVPLKVKTVVSLLMLYVLGIVLLVFAGYYGAGLIWLLGASMFAIVFFDNKYGTLILLVNFFILLSIWIYIKFGFPGWQYLLENPDEIWLILTVNFLAVNALMVLVTARVKSNIDEAVQRQVDAQVALIREKEFSDYIIRSIPGIFFLLHLDEKKNCG